MNATLFSLGAWVHRHRIAVVTVWLVAGVTAAGVLFGLGNVLVGGSGAIEGSASQRMDALLQREFGYPFTRPLIVAVSSPQYTIDDPQYRRWLAGAVERLGRLREVRAVLSVLDGADRRLMSADGHATVIVVGLAAASVEEEERAVPLVRNALQAVHEAAARDDPDVQLAVSGHAAITYDINRYHERDANRAEARALPITLAILLLAFGGVLAALIPFGVGAASAVVALALAMLAARYATISVLLWNIVMMLGLATGIDYSLLMVSRFREEMRSGDLQQALARVVASAGRAVLYSGLAVAIGLSGLLFTPLLETRSIGLGGVLVVTLAVAIALTLTPALLSLLAPRIDAPHWLSTRLRQASATIGWHWLARSAIAHPVVTLAAACAVISALALPGAYARHGFSNDAAWFPPGMESGTGARILRGLGLDNAVIPIYVVVRTTDRRPILAPEQLPALANFGNRLARDPRIAEVASPVNLVQGADPVFYRVLYSNPERAFARFPRVAQWFVSHDRSAALFHLIPRSGLPLDEAQRLARELQEESLGGALAIAVGGKPVYYTDFDSSMRSSFPVVGAFVIGVTLVVLFAAFRSYLIPVKAIVANLLAVAAGYGAVVGVFQFGWLAALFGLEQPLTAIPLTVPLLIFCITFGLSMDYEIFLLSRVQELYAAGTDHDTALMRGICGSAPVITFAALVMVVVFGAAISSDIVLLQMIGLGLAVAVAVDATLIRMLLVPALLALAGRWNWYPGARVPAAPH